MGCGSLSVYKYPKVHWKLVAKEGRVGNSLDRLLRSDRSSMGEALMREYEIGAEIGRGRFGVVRRCRSVATGEEFAVKSVDKRLLADSVDRECAAREAKVHGLAAARNPYAAQIHGAYEDDHWVHLVVELLDGPDLCDRIAARGGTPFPEPEAAAVVEALAEGLAACHRRGVAHRDVKPDNVLFDALGHLKLADFGSAQCFLDADGEWAPMRGLVGTPWYVAPEVVAGREYGEKVDVWSVGVVMYMMLSGGAPPFYGDTAAETFEAVGRANLRFPSRVFRSLSPAAKDLMRRMLCRDVARSRASVDRKRRDESGGGTKPGSITVHGEAGRLAAWALRIATYHSSISQCVHTVAAEDNHGSHVGDDLGKALGWSRW
ncbi:hypothetical protein B296_00038358 [Ensete ventricosum]|uniref:Protein kinase domain-containing protein n=1 Tax=Ensete ventricosum TaxID=4639 RepID=A0A426ZWM6_ENSVE|nr:hypothetical protein B296_00038358 [Ensete ventricosum]